MCRSMDQKASVAILATKMPVGVAPELNLRNPSHTSDKACTQWLHLVFET